MRPAQRVIIYSGGIRETNPSLARHQARAAKRPDVADLVECPACGRKMKPRKTDGQLPTHYYRPKDKLRCSGGPSTGPAEAKRRSRRARIL